jgi:hypothetical protein
MGHGMGVAVDPLLGRPCRWPTARRIIDLFEPVQRHVLETTASSTPVVSQTAVTQRTGVHNQVLRLLRLPKNAYGG